VATVTDARALLAALVSQIDAQDRAWQTTLIEARAFLAQPEARPAPEGLDVEVLARALQHESPGMSDAAAFYGAARLSTLYEDAAAAQSGEGEPRVE
jgi:hypothetical protein